MKSFFKFTGHVTCREMHNMYSYPDSVLNSSQLYTIKRGSSILSFLLASGVLRAPVLK